MASAVLLKTHDGKEGHVVETPSGVELRTDGGDLLEKAGSLEALEAKLVENRLLEAAVKAKAANNGVPVASADKAALAAAEKVAKLQEKKGKK